MKISSAQLCWAAITVGRPHKAAVKSFGKYSAYEALYRWNMVRAALNFGGRNSRFKNSDLFDALDPTEKGGVNFYLGMIFAKIAAQDLLKTPWLIHYHWMSKHHAVPASKGKSTPDLLGRSSVTGKWSVFEAKGKVGGYSHKLMEKAKQQASNLTTVDGQACDLYVGTQLYRNSYKQLRFAWEDPPVEDGEPRHLSTNRDMWRRYYSVAHAIYQAQQASAGPSSDQLGFDIGFSEEALNFIEAVNSEGRDYSDELEALYRWSAARYEQPEAEFAEYAPDGILLRIREG